MPRRYRFKGTAFAAAGVITTPFREIIETQAPCTLSDVGGYGCSRVPAFSHRNLLRFHSAHTEVTGSQTHLDKQGQGETYSTLVKARIEGLDIMGMISADLVVANLVSTYNSTVDDQPSIRLIGSRFENLKIAGSPVHVEMSIATLDRHHRHKDLKKAYADDKEGVRDLFGDQDLRNRHPHAPPEVKHFLDAPPPADNTEMPFCDDIATVSIVKKLIPENRALEPYGHVIHIEGFGTIRLGEVRMCHGTRQLSMVQVRFGCPFEGQGSVGVVDDGGSDGN